MLDSPKSVLRGKLLALTIVVNTKKKSWTQIIKLFILQCYKENKSKQGKQKDDYKTVLIEWDEIPTCIRSVQKYPVGIIQMEFI